MEELEPSSARRCRLLLAALGLALALAPETGRCLDLSQTVVVGGGGSSSGGRNLTMDATIGQASVGTTTLTGGKFSMRVGFWTATSGSLGNISARLKVGPGDNALFAGFIVQGTAPKKVLIRSAGPSLTRLGVPGALGNPQLELHDSSNVIARNNDWQITQPGGVITSDQTAEIQKSGLAPSDLAEPAIIATLSPGSYTAIVQGVNSAEGIATVELYDLSPVSESTLANISTRGYIGTGDNVMIGGFIVVTESVNVLIRATGPSLASFGIKNALVNPQLELHDANGMLAGHDDWQTAQSNGIMASDPSEAIPNSGLAPGNSAEPAIIVTLAPGSYTAIVQGADNTSGVGLIEVYQLP